MDSDPSVIEHTWSGRSLSPIVLLYLVCVFAVFIALAHFGFGSADAVKALALAAVGSMATAVPAVLKRNEYRLTPSGLSKRARRPGDAGEFEDLFAWEELSHIVPTRSGFKFYKSLQEPSSFRRWSKVHLMTGYSGSVQVGPRDRARVTAVIDAHGIPRAKPRESVGAGG